jgi:uncharacterized membrane protein
VKRFPFLDWMRGLAVVVMIQCHTFNSFTRLDTREGGPYVMSQFIGGMAAPLFLFMAGMTLAFQMESLQRREASRMDRWLISLRRASYVLLIAYAFRFANWAATLPHADWHELTKVDILNCMGVGLMVFTVAALFHPRDRARVAIAGAIAIAAASPLVSSVAWGNTPLWLHDYLAPGGGLGHFAIFPWASYIGFGLAAGTVVRRAPEDRLERTMQWAVLIGMVMIFTGQYLSNIPYSLYTKSSFWIDSPTLIVIRAGISYLCLAGAYLWTEYCAGPRWSWMQCLGRNSLMVYWVHVMLVYGDIWKPLKRTMSVPQTVVATILVTLLMIGMSAVWLAWKARRAEKWRIATSVAGTSPRSFATQRF